MIDRDLEARLTEAISDGYLAVLSGQPGWVAEWLAPDNGDGPDTSAYLCMAILRRLRINEEDLAASQLETALFERTCAVREAHDELNAAVQEILSDV